SLDGYDEVSLTSDFKIISKTIESIWNPSNLGFDLVQPESLFGGDSIQQSADIFLNVLNRKGTVAQNSVVIANSALALYCAKKHETLEDCKAEAEESLISGKALKSFKKLIIE